MTIILHMLLWCAIFFVISLIFNRLTGHIMEHEITKKVKAQHAYTEKLQHYLEEHDNALDQHCD